MVATYRKLSRETCKGKAERGRIKANGETKAEND